MNNDDKLNHERWTAVAVAIGFNYLVTVAKELDEKVYFRMSRDNAVKFLKELGGKSNLFESPDEILSLEVSDTMPRVRFRNTDIEAMREAVAKYDREKSCTTAPMNDEAYSG